MHFFAGIFGRFGNGLRFAAAFGENGTGRALVADAFRKQDNRV
jgi:hypothetical protein